MTTSTPALGTGPPQPTRLRALSAFMHRNVWLRLLGLLAAPMFWLGVAYLGSLAALFVTAFWSTDSFTGDVVRSWTLDNYRQLVETDVYRRIVFRTIGVAVAVTVIDAIIAFPVAFYMAKLASPRVQKLLVVAVLMPLWASYLVKGYAWRVLLSEHGLIDSTFGGTPGFGLVAVIITLSYLWLPYMILPVFAGLLRLPDSVLEASGDLGARPGRTLRSVVIPMVFPAIAAGSIFTFSLSLGDYISVKIVGGTTQLLGNVVYDNIGAASNLPFAAAMATVSVVVMLIYLGAVRRTGALDNL
jgi:putative spermidine/putrescine transport system permease protein